MSDVQFFLMFGAIIVITIVFVVICITSSKSEDKKKEEIRKQRALEYINFAQLNGYQYYEGMKTAPKSNVLVNGKYVDRTKNDECLKKYTNFSKGPFVVGINRCVSDIIEGEYKGFKFRVFNFACDLVDNSNLTSYIRRNSDDMDFGSEPKPLNLAVYVIECEDVRTVDIESSKGIDTSYFMENNNLVHYVEGCLSLDKIYTEMDDLIEMIK